MQSSQQGANHAVHNMYVMIYKLGLVIYVYHAVISCNTTFGVRLSS